MRIEFVTAFPVEWGREYYTIESEEKQTRAACTACDNTGKVTIKGEEYTCPRCSGRWREREVVGSAKVYSVGKWNLKQIEVVKPSTIGAGISLKFERINGKGAFANSVTVRERDFETMEVEEYGKRRRLNDDYKEALTEVKRLNAEQKERNNDGSN